MPWADAARHLREGVVARERLRRANPGARIASTVRLSGEPGRVRLAAGVSLHGPTSISVLDGGGRTGSRLTVGDRTYVGEFCNIRCGGAPVRIGQDTLIAQGVSIIGTQHMIAADALIGTQPWVGDGVTIGSDVWVGAGATLLPGVLLEDGAVVGAHSVVLDGVPSGTIVAGAPARIIRRRQ